MTVAHSIIKVDSVILLIHDKPFVDSVRSDSRTTILDQSFIGESERETESLVTILTRDAVYLRGIPSEEQRREVQNDGGASPPALVV